MRPSLTRPHPKNITIMTRDSIESAYCFFHQKYRVYEHSTMDWQKDDIEYAIAGYAATMDKELYTFLSHGNPDYLLDHRLFARDMQDALEKLETMMEETDR